MSGLLDVVVGDAGPGRGLTVLKSEAAQHQNTPKGKIPPN